MAKDKSRLGGSTGSSASDKDVSVCELWLSWLSTGDTPTSTLVCGVANQVADTSSDGFMWPVAGKAPWWSGLDHSIPSGRYVLTSKGTAVHISSGNWDWLQSWVMLSKQSDEPMSEMVSGGVGGKASPYGSVDSPQGTVRHHWSTSEG
jgi:hypothetical protein